MENRLDDSVRTPVGGSNKNDPPLFWDRCTHYTLRRTDPSLLAPHHDVDWWRAPKARKGLLHRLLGLFKR